MSNKSNYIPFYPKTETYPGLTRIYTHLFNNDGLIYKCLSRKKLFTSQQNQNKFKKLYRSEQSFNKKKSFWQA